MSTVRVFRMEDTLAHSYLQTLRALEGMSTEPTPNDYAEMFVKFPKKEVFVIEDVDELSECLFKGKRKVKVKDWETAILEPKNLGEFTRELVETGLSGNVETGKAKAKTLRLLGAFVRVVNEEEESSYFENEDEPPKSYVYLVERYGEEV